MNKPDISTEAIERAALDLRTRSIPYRMDDVADLLEALAADRDRLAQTDELAQLAIIEAESERDRFAKERDEANEDLGSTEIRLKLTEAVAEAAIASAEKAEAERDKALWELGATKDVVMLTEEEFAEFERAMLEPPNPTEAALRGQAMLREWAAKRKARQA